MKKIVFLLGIFYLITSCSDNDQVSVKYMASGSVSAYSLKYIDSSGELTSEEVTPASAQDIWEISYIADKGSITYISGNYKDIYSSLNLMILIDGKMYKQATSVGDTLSFLTVSGTIPY